MNDAPDTIEYKGKIIGKIGKCVLISVPTPNGKEHIEATCQSKEARDHLAAILEQESILRVNPKVILEDTPDIGPKKPEPEPEPGPELPVSKLNPTES
ncbi:unnamed protein product [marine sediment metagenome]|uniref:Uncharacterized protein n=1 Tax=marine sediment metagenome TaxID=412755 RepID=X1LDB0_9ZZZZ